MWLGSPQLRLGRVRRATCPSYNQPRLESGCNPNLGHPLGNGVMAARLVLAQVVQVRVLVPQSERPASGGALEPAQICPLVRQLPAVAGGSFLGGAAGGRQGVLAPERGRG